MIEVAPGKLSRNLFAGVLSLGILMVCPGGPLDSGLSQMKTVSFSPIKPSSS